jgi:hypothetical protein
MQYRAIVIEAAEKEMNFTSCWRV